MWLMIPIGNLAETSNLCYSKFTSKVNFKRGDNLDITYKNKKIEKICTDAKTAERTYGKEMAEKIHNV